MTAPVPETSATAAPVPAPVPAVPAMQLDHVSRWYGNVVAVNDVSFALGAGVTGLLGPNGAGKSTLLHLLAGLLAPSSGTVRIGGRAAFGDPSVYSMVGLVPEREAVPNYLTGREFVRFSAELQAVGDVAAAADKAIATVELDDSADRQIRTYSKGMRQRIKLAAALVHDPRILLLDEPFNGMDPRQRLHMMELLRRMAGEGRAILFSSHILEEVERLAEAVLVVYAGRLAASGDFRSIRRLMTDRPHRFTIRSSDDAGGALLSWRDAEQHGPWNSMFLVGGAVAMTDALTQFGFAEAVGRLVSDLGIGVTMLPYAAAAAAGVATNFISGTALFASIFVPAAQQIGFNPASMAILLAHVGVGLIFPWAGATSATAFAAGEVGIARMIWIGFAAK